ncbi:hypothetical protein [Streptomyces sp. NBC_00893]|uniref:hypothetical protein n=1 Tax=Streptomyces sp. NBC_00893 TaxID=2975862 RepID=UPI00224D0A2D|nr:hypothetical protein [Streptomyces sp. NBC_00893]
MSTSVLVRGALLVTALGVLEILFVVPAIWTVAASVKPLPEIFKAGQSRWTAGPTLSAHTEAFGFQPFARPLPSRIQADRLIRDLRFRRAAPADGHSVPNRPFPRVGSSMAAPETDAWRTTGRHPSPTQSPA